MQKDFIDNILSTLKSLSKSASRANEILNSFDYAAELRMHPEDPLPIELDPVTFKELHDDVMRHCCSIIGCSKNISEYHRLDGTNLKLFVEHVNVSHDNLVAKRISYIDTYPIREVASKFDELGYPNEARLLDNVCAFADGFHSSYYSDPFRLKPENGSTKYAINITLPPEELNESELEEAENYKIFSSIFRPGAIGSSQKKALYNGFKNLLTTEGELKPHLTIAAALLLLRIQKSYGKPLNGTYHSNKISTFKSLGLPEKAANSYTEDAFKNGVKPSLALYKQKAMQLVEKAMEITR